MNEDPKQNCDNCSHRRNVTMPGSIQKTDVCTVNPPTAMLIPMQGGAQVMSMQPPTPPSRICGQYKWDYQPEPTVAFELNPS